MQRTLDWLPDDTGEAKLTKLEQALEGTKLVLNDAVPLMASLLSLELSEDRYPPLTLSPQQQRQQTQDTLVAWLQEEAERHPILVVWEDLHWADPSTLEVIGLFVEQAPTVAALHLVTFRPEFEPPWPTRSHLTPITLNRLERSQVEALITHMADGKTLPIEVVKHVVAKTDGVPLYVEELTKMLLNSELLCEEPEQYVLTGPLVAVAIPDTLQDSLMARLDQLNTAKEMAQLGAVLGREFSYEMIQIISSPARDTLDAGLAQLVESELLYQRGRPPQSTYIFKHALVQDAAYQSLLKRTRQRIHEQVVAALELHFPEFVETQPELLAHHAMEAGMSEKAMNYWQQAGEQAVKRLAYVEAMAHFRQGLDLLMALPDIANRLDDELAFRLRLGNALKTVKGFAAPEVESEFTRAYALCQHLGETPHLLQVLYGLRLFYLMRGLLSTACEIGESNISIWLSVNRIQRPCRRGTF